MECVYLLALATCAMCVAGQKPPLQFTPGGKFRIVQFADMHFGEGEEAAWGPVQDAKSLSTMRDVITTECSKGMPIDLAVLSGDQLTGLNILKNATKYWDMITDELRTHNLPHTAILGNHDAEPFSGHGNQSGPGAFTTRTQLMQHDVEDPLSYSKVGPLELRPAVSTFVVDVFPAGNTSGAPALQIVHLDSGGGGMVEEVYPPQIEWFNEQLAKRRAKHGIVPTLVWVHIPMPEFQSAIKNQARCFGSHDDDIAPTVVNTGLFDAVEANKEVVGVFVGHNHCNDFCCTYGKTRSVDLCFGRHSGGGGYNCALYEIGARIVEVELGPPVRVKTYIRARGGGTLHHGELKWDY